MKQSQQRHFFARIAGLVLAGLWLLPAPIQAQTQIQADQPEDLRIARDWAVYDTIRQEALLNPFKRFAHLEVSFVDSAPDVVEWPTERLQSACESGEILPLPEILQAEAALHPAEAVTSCSLGAGHHALIIAHPPALDLPEGVTGWALFWATEDFPGLRAVPDDPRQLLELTLLAAGHPPEGIYAHLATEEGTEQAFAALEDIRDSLVFYDPAAPQEVLPLLRPDLRAETEETEEEEQEEAVSVVLAAAPHYIILGSNHYQDGRLRLLWPQMIHSYRGWAIPATARNPSAAVRFIGYASQPETQLRLAALLPVGVTHQDALPQLRAPIRLQMPSDPEYLEEALAYDPHFWRIHGERLQSRYATWRTGANDDPE